MSFYSNQQHFIIDNNKMNSKAMPNTPELDMQQNPSPTHHYMPTQEDLLNALPLFTQQPGSTTSSTFSAEYPLTQYTPPTSGEDEANETQENDTKKQKVMKEDEEQADTEDEENSIESNTEKQAKVEGFLRKACSINFAHVCPYCKKPSVMEQHSHFHYL